MNACCPHTLLIMCSNAGSGSDKLFINSASRQLPHALFYLENVFPTFSRSLFQTRLYRLRPCNRTSSILGVVLRPCSRVSIASFYVQDVLSGFCSRQILSTCIHAGNADFAGATIGENKISNRVKLSNIFLK